MIRILAFSAVSVKCSWDIKRMFLPRSGYRTERLSDQPLAKVALLGLILLIWVRASVMWAGIHARGGRRRLTAPPRGVRATRGRKRLAASRRGFARACGPRARSLSITRGST